MLRTARRAVVAIEPHYGLCGRLLGAEWERHDDVENFVFRWSRETFEQLTRSYLLSKDATIEVHRTWDHSRAVGKAVSHLPPRLQLPAARTVYAALRPPSRVGNMFVGVVIK